MLNKLIKLANQLDLDGLVSEADDVDVLVDNFIAACELEKSGGFFDFLGKKNISPEIRHAVEKYFNKINDDYDSTEKEGPVLGELVEIRIEEEDGETSYVAVGSNYSLHCWVVTPESVEAYKKEFGENSVPTGWHYGIPIDGTENRIYGEW